ncbi:MAG: GAF domain-containing protein [Magnetococcales bacterium]|nr:GAF domain-containing protein [Magnetococcales bacterium]
MHFGLREKMMLYLVGGVLLIGGVTLTMVRSMQERIQLELTRYSVERYVMLHREKTLGGIQGDLMLALKLADSEVVRRWARDPSDPVVTASAMRELGSFLTLFSSRELFVASKPTGQFYFVDASALRDARQSPLKSAQALTVDDLDDAWFFKTLADTAPYNFNVDHNNTLNVTKLWINVVMKEGQEPVAVVGTGIDITKFIESFVKSPEKGVTGMFVNEAGAIQGHADPTLIAQNASIDAQQATSTIWKLLASEQEVERLKVLMNRVKGGGSGELLELTISGVPRVVAVAYIAPLKWFTVAAFDRTSVIGSRDFLTVLAVMLLAMVVSSFLVYVIGNRLVVKPLRMLAEGTRRVAEGQFDLHLPEDRQDEIGAVMVAFSGMAKQISESRRLVQTNVATITAALQRATSYWELSRIFFTHVAPILDVGVGGFYRVDGGRGVLVACGGYARSGDDVVPEEIPFGSGLVGQCASEQRTIRIENPPSGYLKIGSVLGASPPRVLLLVPIIHAGTLLGVIEIASFRAFREDEITLLNGLLTVVGMCMEIIERNERMGGALSLEVTR